MADPILFALAVRKLFRMVVDRLVKSPLEEDFGEYSEEDIQLPPATYATTTEFGDAAGPFAAMAAALDGFDAEDVKRIATRMHEIRLNRSATLPFQIVDGGDTVELRIAMEKVGPRALKLDFRSSEAVIDAVRAAFEGPPA